MAYKTIKCSPEVLLPDAGHDLVLDGVTSALQLHVRHVTAARVKTPQSTRVAVEQVALVRRAPARRGTVVVEILVLDDICVKVQILSYNLFWFSNILIVTAYYIGSKLYEGKTIRGTRVSVINLKLSD